MLALLEPLTSVVNDNHMIPICQSVKIEIYENTLFITGTNTEINCINKSKIKADVKVDFCVNFSKLISILKSIKNQEVNFKLSDNALQLIHDKGVLKLPTEPSREFPNPENEEFKKKAKVNGAQLKSALKVANKFVLNSELEAMANISLQVGKKIIVRSTNRTTLFQEKIKGKGDSQMILISGKASNSIFTLIEDEEVQMRYNSNKIFFKFKDREIMVVQQQGDFPVTEFDRIADSIDEAEKLEIDYDEFIDSLKRTSILSSKATSKVIFDISKKKLQLSCDDIDMSTKAQETIKAKFSDSKTLAFNVKFLIEVLGVFEKDSTFLINAANCFCIKSKKKKGLISPMLVN